MGLIKKYFEGMSVGNDVSLFEIICGIVLLPLIILGSPALLLYWLLTLADKVKLWSKK